LLALSDKDCLQLLSKDGECPFGIIGKGSDSLGHGEHRGVSASCAVAEMTGRHHVGVVDVSREFGTLLGRQVAEPDIDCDLYLRRISSLTLPDKVLDCELPPKVEVNFWPGSAATQLTDSAGSQVRRATVAEERLEAGLVIRNFHTHLFPCAPSLRFLINRRSSADSLRLARWPV
jgi:hypothetical protein